MPCKEQIDEFREKVIEERAGLMAENARYRMALEVIAAGINNVSAREIAQKALRQEGDDHE